MKLADRLNYPYMVRACWRLGNAAQRRMLVTIYVVFFIANCFMLTEPLIIARMVRTITLGGPDVVRSLSFWSLMWVFNTVIFWAFHGSGRLMEKWLAYALWANYTQQLYRRVTHLPWSWHQDNHSGGVLSRLNLAAQSLFEFTEQQYVFVQLTMTMVGSIGVLLWIAPSAGLIMAIGLPLLTIVFSRFDVALAHVSRTRSSVMSYISAALVDYLGNIATVLTLRLQQSTGNELMRRIAGLKQPSFREGQINEGKWMAFSLCMRVIQASAIIVFVWKGRTVDAATLAGVAVAILQYMRSVGAAFQQSGGAFQGLIRSRINIEAADFGGDLDVIENQQVIEGWHNAEITGLAFSYRDREQQAHHLDVSLSLARGRRIALVGTSGSGKSTLLRLLRGLHETEAGTLTVDGRAYPNIGPLASLSTLVPQDPEIFENTIGYNITCGIEGDEGALQAAIHAAALESVIADLPQGLATDIRERGVNLSGGQKQRLALARGLLAARGSSLILLDEPTSSLDAATEALVFERLLAMHGQACIVASLHRLHLLERFDHVYVMEAGRIVEQGTLAQLIAAGGVFTSLWQAQQAERAEAS